MSLQRESAATWHPSPVENDDEVDRPQWTVWRQDDNGNQFVVAHHVDRGQAETQATEMESRGHKQTYWVARKT